MAILLAALMVIDPWRLWRASPQEAAGNELIIELLALKDGDGLYRHPGASLVGDPAVEASAYSMQTTYYAGWLAYQVQGADDVIGPETPAALRAGIETARRRGDDMGAVYGIAVLHTSVGVSEHLRREAVTTLREYLRRPLDRNRVGSEQMLIDMLRQLGGEVPRLRVQPWPVSSAEDRYQEHRRQRWASYTWHAARFRPHEARLWTVSRRCA